MEHLSAQDLQLRDELADRLLKHTSIAAAAFAAIATFFAQPLIQFADPVLMSAGGVLFAGAASIQYMLFWSLAKPRKLAWLAAAVGGLGLTLLGAGLVIAVKAADQHSSTCKTLQRGILKPTTATRSDLPEVFQALGCIPQRI